jgi:hypothetical protein
MQIITITQKGRQLARSIDAPDSPRAKIVATLDFYHGQMTSDQVHDLVGEDSGLWIRSLERDGIITVT